MKKARMEITLRELLRNAVYSRWAITSVIGNLGYIVDNTKRSECRLCSNIIYKGRKKIRLQVNFQARGKDARLSYQSYHLDCYNSIINNDIDTLKKHKTKISRNITKKYLDEKKQDLVLEQI